MWQGRCRPVLVDQARRPPDLSQHLRTASAVAAGRARAHRGGVAGLGLGLGGASPLLGPAAPRKATCCAPVRRLTPRRKRALAGLAPEPARTNQEMADSPTDSERVDAGSVEDASPRHYAASAGGPQAADTAARDDKDEIPLALLRCLNKTHPANCTRQVNSLPCVCYPLACCCSGSHVAASAQRAARAPWLPHMLRVATAAGRVGRACRSVRQLLSGRCRRTTGLPRAPHAPCFCTRRASRLGALPGSGLGWCHGRTTGVRASQGSPHACAPFCHFFPDISLSPRAGAPRRLARSRRVNLSWWASPAQRTARRSCAAG
jgi:hypothetical protein